MKTASRGAKAGVTGVIAVAVGGCCVPPTTPTTPSSLTGYQLVSNSLRVGPLQTQSQTAICPPGKVALSAGYTAAAVQRPGVDVAAVERGLEVKRARPVWPAVGQSYAEVELRNANVFEPAELTVTAVCVDRRPDLRIADATNGVTNAGIANPRGRHPLGCGAGEVVVGGGASVPHPGHLKINAPQADGLAWDAEAFQAGVANSLTLQTTVVCASASLVAGRSIGRSGPTSLAGHGSTPQSIRCPGRSKVLAAGVADSTGVTGIDMIVVSLDIVGSSPMSPGSVTSQVHNRNTIGGPNGVVAETTAICADVS